MKEKMVNIGGLEVPEEMIQSMTRNVYNLLSNEPLLLKNVIEGSMRGEDFIQDLPEELAEMMDFIMPGRIQAGPAAAFTLEIAARIHVIVAHQIVQENLASLI